MGDSLSCGYFEKFFGSQSKAGNTDDISDGRYAKIVDKKNFLDNFIYDITQYGDITKQRATDQRETSSVVVLKKTNTKKSLSHLPEYKVKEPATITEIILKELDDVQQICKKKIDTFS